MCDILNAAIVQTTTHQQQILSKWQNDCTRCHRWSWGEHDFQWRTSGTSAEMCHQL